MRMTGVPGLAVCRLVLGEVPAAADPVSSSRMSVKDWLNSVVVKVRSDCSSVSSVMPVQQSSTHLVSSHIHCVRRVEGRAAAVR